MIKDKDGRWRSKQEVIQDVIVSFFKDIFQCGNYEDEADN